MLSKKKSSNIKTSPIKSDKYQNPQDIDSIFEEKKQKM